MIPKDLVEYLIIDDSGRIDFSTTIPEDDKDTIRLILWNYQESVLAWFRDSSLDSDVTSKHLENIEDAIFRFENPDWKFSSVSVSLYGLTVRKAFRTLESWFRSEELSSSVIKSSVFSLILIFTCFQSRDTYLHMQAILNAS